MLSGDRAAPTQRPFCHTAGPGFGGPNLFRLTRIDQQDRVEIAVADMAKDRASAEMGTQTSVTTAFAPSRVARIAR